MSKGYVYILSNESMPGLVKIGKTTRSVEQRAGELYQTGVPTPFKEDYSVLCPDCDQIEAAMHQIYKDERVSVGREFFRVDLYQAIEVLDQCLEVQVKDWIAEFLPDHMITRPECVPDPGLIGEIAQKAEVHPFEAASAMELIEPDELSPALERYKHQCAERRKEIDARKVVQIGANK